MTPGSKRFWIFAALSAGCTLVLLVLYGFNFLPLLETEWGSQDFRMRHGRKTAIDPRLVFVGIDKPTYADFLSEEEMKSVPVLAMVAQNFPWSREVWADLIERLGQAGAKVIAIDLLFAAPWPGDDALKAALKRHQSRVVIGSNFSDVQSDQGHTLTLTLPSESLLDETASGSPAEDGRVGYINIWTDPDKVLRRARYRASGEDLSDALPPQVIVESLAARSLRKFGRPDAVPAGTDARLFRYTRPPGFGYKPLPLYTLFLPDLWKNNYQNGRFFRDKIVIVGPAANIFHDEHATPFRVPKSEMLGPEIHLNIIGAALQGEFLRETSKAINLATIALAGVLAWALAFLRKQILRRIAIVVGLSCCYALLCQVLFDRANLVVLAVSPLLALNFSSLLIFGYDFVLERMEKRRTRKTLERYVSRDVVKELLDNPESYLNTLGGVRKSVTILFSDVRGFTTMTEGADAALLVQQLNEYFKEMVRVVFIHKGRLDKFIGDAVMADWGSILTDGLRRDAQNAVATALSMKRSLAHLNQDWKARGLPELAFGIGINHGEVIVGNLGSDEKMEVSVIGDPVNLASRLEGLTKEYHLDLLFGESMVPLVSEKYILRTVDSVQVRGKTKPVDVFTVCGEGGPETTSMPVWLARYEQGVRRYRQGAFADAMIDFRECLRRQPDDYLSALYLERCQSLLANPPGENWNGTFVMTK